MFSKFALLAFAAVAVQALTLNTPTDVTSGGRITLTWISEQSDPIFTLELHHPSLLQDIAIANNVDPSLESLDILMPIVLARDDQYVIRAVNVSNINDEFARTGNFFIGDTVSASTTPSSTGSATSATNPPSGTTVTTRPTTATGSGSTSNSASGSGSGSPTSSGSAATDTPLNGNNGANGIVANLGLVAAAVGAVAAVL
ncbi:hypothetical protein VNI00_004422 [Paramarasmius palmivorus]|uniref:Uncharacterized protein n=1 Tax=Paramarasmius palmivorus TaxID=297713 RepID=A0AAW0DF61_9AGAR